MGGINMTPGDKELLLKDLCARLPYGVKLGFYATATKQTYVCTLLGLEPQEDKPIIAKTENGSFYMLADNVKPYLFPLSSMTDNQKKEYQYITERWMYDSSYSISDSIDWLNKNHFDYHNLIDKNLAIDATGLNIY